MSDEDKIARLAGRTKRFISLCRELSPGIADVIPIGWFSVLSGLYGQPHRKYHTLDHVANLLERLDGLAETQCTPTRR